MLSAFRVLATSQRRRALVVFFTDVVDVARRPGSFIAYAGRAAQRHLFVVVAIQNEALIDRRAAGERRCDALYRERGRGGAGARARRSARAHAAAPASSCSTSPPSRMAAAVVNRYLEIKARGQL